MIVRSRSWHLNLKHITLEDPCQQKVCDGEMHQRVRQPLISSKFSRTLAEGMVIIQIAFYIMYNIRVSTFPTLLLLDTILYLYIPR